MEEAQPAAAAAANTTAGTADDAVGQSLVDNIIRAVEQSSAVPALSNSTSPHHNHNNDDDDDDKGAQSTPAAAAQPQPQPQPAQPPPQSEHALAALVEAAGRDTHHHHTSHPSQPQQPPQQQPPIDSDLHDAHPPPTPPLAYRSTTHLGKRKAGHVLTLHEKHALVRDTVQRHLRSLNSLYSPDGSPLPPNSTNTNQNDDGSERVAPVMTTVRCMHGSVAQKSYGSEKRFLCPPPVVKVSGPLRYHTENNMFLDLPSSSYPQPLPSPSSPSGVGTGGSSSIDQPCPLPSLSMNVISEDGQSTYSEQHAGLDTAMHSRFRFLHVAGTGKSKNFRLQLNLLRARRGKDGRPLAKSSRRAADGVHPGGSLDLAAVAAAAAAAHKDATEPLGAPRYGSPLGAGPSFHLEHALDDGAPAGLSSPGVGASGTNPPRTYNVNFDQVAKMVPLEPWASFESAPVGIISKPSRKSAKVRNTSSNIVSGSLIALYSRINSQTVRTKYMAVGNNHQHLVSLHGGWSAFRISLIARPPEASYAAQDEDIVTYGSVVILTDAATGCSTDPLVLCKVDRGKIYIPRSDVDEDDEYYDEDGSIAAARAEARRDLERIVAESSGSRQGEAPPQGTPTGAVSSNGAGAGIAGEPANDHAAATIQEIAERAAAMAESSAAEMERAAHEEHGHNGHGHVHAHGHGHAPMQAQTPTHEQIFAEAHAQALSAAGLQPHGYSAPPASVSAYAQGSLGRSAASRRIADEHNIFGAISQMQKVAFLRFVPRSDISNPESEEYDPKQASLDPDFDAERYYLTAMDYDRFVKDDGSGTVHAKGREQEATIYPPAEDYYMGENGINPAGTMEGPVPVMPVGSAGAGAGAGASGVAGGADPPLVYAPPPPILNGRPMRRKRNEDDIDDSFGWTMVGISQFEFSFFEAYGQPTHEGVSTLPITPFPIITSMPLYDARSHTLTTTALNFYYYPEDDVGQPTLVPMEVWLGPLGPLVCRSKPRSDRTGGESEIAVDLPGLELILEVTREQREIARRGAGGVGAGTGGSAEGAAAPAPTADEAEADPDADDPAGHIPQYLPLLFVRGSDGTGYHSGRHIALEDLESLMQSAGQDPSAADALHNLGMHQPPGGPEAETWSLRVV